MENFLIMILAKVRMKLRMKMKTKKEKMKEKLMKMKRSIGMMFLQKIIQMIKKKHTETEKMN